MPLTAPRACPGCGGAGGEPVFALRDFQFFTDAAVGSKRVDVVTRQCPACLTLYQSPGYTPHGFAVLFAEAGRSYGHTDGRPAEQIAWLGARGLLAPGRRVLDVGCADGSFLAALPATLERVGVDVDAETVARCGAPRAREGVRLVAGDFATFEYPGPADTMTMFHVLEHVVDPVAVLVRLRAIAGPDTRLVVEVPILEHGATNDLNGFFSVQHLTHFSARSLARCLARAGWTVVEAVAQAAYNGWRVLAAPGPVCDGPPPDPADRAALAAYLGTWRAARAAVERVLAPVASAPRCAVWGAGLHTEFLYQTTAFFRAHPEREWMLIDGDPLKHGRTWRGLPIRPPAALAATDLGGAPLVVSSYGSQDEIAAAAVARGVATDRVVRLYDALHVY